jgi:hypothetical protein
VKEKLSDHVGTGRLFRPLTHLALRPPCHFFFFLKALLFGLWNYLVARYNSNNIVKWQEARGQPHLTRYSRAERSGCEEKMHLRTSLVWGDSVGLKTRPPRGHQVLRVVLPTKTSLSVMQFIGRSLFSVSSCSQVFTIRLVNPSFRLIRVAVILSVVSLSLVTRSHLLSTSLIECCSPWITLSPLISHIRCADSARRIWRSLVGPWRVFFVPLLGSRRLLQDCSFMQPQPRIVPRLRAGQGMLWKGHMLRASDLSSMIGLVLVDQGSFQSQKGEYYCDPMGF